MYSIPSETGHGNNVEGRLGKIILVEFILMPKASYTAFYEAQKSELTLVRARLLPVNSALGRKRVALTTLSLFVYYPCFYPSLNPSRYNFPP